jgi:3-phenylpropionate/cinnamic acid dioxygenase small subunit
MNDSEAVHQLYAHYAAGMDNAQFELTREVFASNSRFSLNIQGTEAVPPIDGKQAIGDFIETTTREQNDQRRHVITNIRSSVEGGKTVAYGYLALFVTTDDGVAIQCTGQYRSEIVEEGGKLHFGHMHLDLDGAF